MNSQHELMALFVGQCTQQVSYLLFYLIDSHKKLSQKIMITKFIEICFLKLQVILLRKHFQIHDRYDELIDLRMCIFLVHFQVTHVE